MKLLLSLIMTVSFSAQAKTNMSVQKNYLEALNFLKTTIPAEVLTICDNEDTREPSQDKFAGRIIKSITGGASCTANLIGNNCMITAGHCTGSSMKFVEFNTPLSKNGKIVHSKAEDVYPIDTDRVAKVNGGKGNDWAVFKIKKNNITDLFPEEAQKGFLEVSLESPSIETPVQITGYGVDYDNSDRNQAQQTSFAPTLFAVGKVSSSSLQYRSDTTGGNSGSAVRNADTQEVIGVHTHGGCDDWTESANVGTSLANNKEFKEAVLECLAN